MNAAAICKAQDTVCDALHAKLGTNDGSDSNLICHWQEGDGAGFVISLTRKSDGKTMLKKIDTEGNVIF